MIAWSFFGFPSSCVAVAPLSYGRLSMSVMFVCFFHGRVSRRPEIGFAVIAGTSSGGAPSKYCSVARSSDMVIAYGDVVKHSLAHRKADQVFPLIDRWVV